MMRLAFGLTVGLGLRSLMLWVDFDVSIGLDTHIRLNFSSAFGFLFD